MSKRRRKIDMIFVVRKLLTRSEAELLILRVLVGEAGVFGFVFIFYSWPTVQRLRGRLVGIVTGHDIAIMVLPVTRNRLLDWASSVWDRPMRGIGMNVGVGVSVTRRRCIRRRGRNRRLLLILMMSRVHCGGR